MNNDDMPEDGRESKTTLPWFKKYPEAYLEGTRMLTPEQRGIYEDCLCLIYKYDRELPKLDSWMAHELHVSVKVWRRVRAALIACGKLVETQTGFINNRALNEIQERRELKMNRGSAATQRQLKRVSEPELPFENNARCTIFPPRTPVHARASSSESREEKKERALLRVVGADEEEHRTALRISGHTRLQLADVIGAEFASELVDAYLASPLAAGARSIEDAFKGWLRKQGIDLSGPRRSMNRAEMQDVLAMCGTDATGRPDTTLPKVVSKR